jgi:hypothetical protein
MLQLHLPLSLVRLRPLEVQALVLLQRLRLISVALLSRHEVQICPLQML